MQTNVKQPWNRLVASRETTSPVVHISAATEITQTGRSMAFAVTLFNGNIDIPAASECAGCWFTFHAIGTDATGVDVRALGHGGVGKTFASVVGDKMTADDDYIFLYSDGYTWIVVKEQTT